MKQADSEQFDEYITLRQEMLQLLSYCRNILYWTVIFAVVSFGWNFSGSGEPRLAVELYSLVLWIFTTLSLYIYYINLNAVFHVGGYIAVFWESSDPDRHLTWHRYNRRSAMPGGFFPREAIAIYAVLAIGILILSLLYFILSDDDKKSFFVYSIVWFLSLCLGKASYYFIKKTEVNRDDYEKEWRRIRGDEVRKRNIHREYETIPVENVLDHSSC